MIEYTKTLDFVRKLRSIDLKTCEDRYIQELICELFEQGVPVIQTTINKGIFVHRMRKGTGYKTIKDLSYKDAKYCRTYQRATVKGETAFYGVIADDWEKSTSARYVTICECSSLFRENIDKGREVFTIAKWRANRSLKLVGVFSVDTFENYSNNKLIDDIKEEFFSLRASSKELTEFDDITMYFTHEFIKEVSSAEDWQYRVTATFVSTLLKLDDTIDGVIYPSGRSGLQGGMNVALRPSVADRALCFDMKAKEVVYKKGDVLIQRIEGHAFRIDEDFIPRKNLDDKKLCEELQIYNIIDLPLIK